MPTLSGTRPPSTAAPSSTDGAAVLFTSSLPLRSRRYALAFLRDAVAIRRLLDGMLADPDGGLVRYELRAHPIANRYETESVWESEAHLERFAAHPLHVEVMRRQAPRLGAATFERRMAP